MGNGTFPEHGPIVCRECFKGTTLNEMDVGDWHVVNDPGAWGSSSPTVLVLGFSKGFTQANAFKGERFEDVPFKKIRHRLDLALRRIGIIASPDTSESIDKRFEADEETFAFGSLVRCSLSRLNRKTGKYECTGPIMTQAFREPVKEVVRTCAERYLTALPPSVKVVVLLGTSDAYIKSCRSLIQSLNPSTFSDINPVAYRAAGVIWLHITHPSQMNGTFSQWLSGGSDGGPGLKREYAIQALASVAS